MIEFEQLGEIPLIDTHVHRFLPSREGDFSAIAGGYIPGPGQQEFGRQTLLYGMIMEALRKKFGFAQTASWEEVEAQRHKLYADNPQLYCHSLLDGQNIAMYCMEIGSPMGGPAYTEEEISLFHTLIPKEKCCDIVRIDRILDDIFPLYTNFDEFIIGYQEQLRKQIRDHRTVGLKSCCAYNGGLNLGIYEKDEARKAFDSLKLHEENFSARKVLYEFMLMESTDAAVENHLPIQIHTGAGGGRWLDFKTQDPVNLIDYLKDPRIQNRAKIVLLHGGHPYEENAAYITAQFSNVYTDFSGTFYLCSAKGLERMAALLERTPLNKIMYGSDGVGYPELSWFAHDWFRSQLSKLLNRLTKDGYITEQRAWQLAHMIMHENAKSCYTNLCNYL